MELGVALCAIKLERYNENHKHLEKIDYVKNFTISGKHISFLEFKNSYSRTNREKNVSTILRHHRLGENFSQSIQSQLITI